MEAAQIITTPAPFDDCRELASALGLDPAVAQLLVRRGLGDPAVAADFLKADERHHSDDFEGISAAVELTLAHVNRGSTVMIHGDYDVDGVCSTAILVRTLRSLGANVEWFIPGRREDGYGLGLENVERFAAGPASLLITVDCAITAVDEVARAKELGLDVIVTDHHHPRSDGVLPDAPIVHPRVCGYPDPELCATGVAYKFAQALRRAAGGAEVDEQDDLDLVALATVADCVPLVRENRRLVREGLVALARTQRPGLRALMRVAQVDPAEIDEQTIGFRLAPRINAAGRMQRADSGVELMLTDDPVRADAIADELDHANNERKLVEAKVRHEAEQQARDMGDRDGYIIAGDDWHPGVIGIVASRLAESLQRPVVIIALDGDEGSGSGRSIPGFDLLNALHGCADDMIRYGGHSAAAGCTVARDAVPQLREHFEAYCAAYFADQPAVAVRSPDAVIGGDGLSLELAQQLGALGPFGIGNPRPSVLIPGARLDGARTMGEGKHLRATITSGGVRVSAVAFGVSKLPAGAERGLDALGSPEINRWRGAEELRFVVRALEPCAARIELLGRPTDDLAALAEAVARGGPAQAVAAEGAEDRELLSRRGGGAAGILGELVATGEPVLVVALSEQRRLAQMEGVIGGFSLISWQGLLGDPAIADAYVHLVALDPPPSREAEAILEYGPPGSFAHQIGGAAELRFSLDELERESDLRSSMASVYRAVRDEPDADLLVHLTAGDPHRSPASMATIVRILDELGLAEFDGFRMSLSGDSSERRELESSPTFIRQTKAAAEAIEWLTAPKSLTA
ncbi:MAG: single-stranded-DNA-specific exonuclease RecJ [Actinobacteria bacterium]|uniref:Single-stranded-DNA-specific exonuclease RecJ n=1 Tax=freshwater metagenome TaxID=449393 RepID=A0A6J5ZJQ5_9ZZZZ|nr:single-stranded-DNA-specific exonuclease RecJ [Actinomycetota bacterium]